MKPIKDYIKQIQKGAEEQLKTNIIKLRFLTIVLGQSMMKLSLIKMDLKRLEPVH